MEVIAFQTILNIRPYIPEYLILKNENGLFMRTNQNSQDLIISNEEYTDLIEKHKICPFLSPEIFQTGFWVCIESNGVVWYPKQEEGIWRAKRASALLQKIAFIKDDPVKVMTVIQSCANMCGINIGTLLTHLESNRESPDETLADIFLRVRPNS